MSELRVVVSMSSGGTRVLATTQDHETILKARLSPSPSHPRALQWLLESLALWQGVPVRAVLAAGKPRSGCGTSLHADWFADFGNALYSLELDPGVRARRRRHRDCVGALGDFRLDTVITRLEAWPNVSGAKPLRAEWKGHHRIRMGDWRVIFKVVRPDLIIVRIAHRSTVYED